MLKDARGTFVSNDFLYIDAHGYVWRLDHETAQAVENYNPAELYYLSNDCTGPAYVYAVPVRYPFLALGETALRVRRDTQLSESLSVSSIRTTSGCRAVGTTVTVIPLANTVPDTPIVRPELGLTPPLHVERP